MNRSLSAALLAAAVCVHGCSPVRPEPPEALAAVAAALPSPISVRVAGEPPDCGEPMPGVLTIEEAVRLALAHDPGVQAAFARVRVAEAEADQAGLLPNPLLSVSVRYPDGGGRPTIEAVLAQDLLSVFQRARLSRVATARLHAATSESVTAVLDALASAEEAYAAVQGLDALGEELLLRRNALGRILELAQLRLRAGEGSLLEVMAAQSKVAEAETEIATKELERTEKRLALARMLGSPSAAIDFRLSRWQPRQTPAGDESHWIEAALANRTELRAKEWELRALEGERGLSWFSLFEGTEAGADSERDDGEWSVGPSLALPIPLFDFGQARRARARAAVSEASHRLTQLRREVIEEVRGARAAAIASAAALDAANRELVPLAERRVQQADAQYRAGEASQSDVLLAEDDRRAAAVRRIELEVQHLTAVIRLERAVGGPAAIAAHTSGISTDKTEETRR